MFGRHSCPQPFALISSDIQKLFITSSGDFHVR
jgi:hypothetical protein